MRLSTSLRKDSKIGCSAADSDQLPQTQYSEFTRLLSTSGIAASSSASARVTSSLVSVQVGRLPPVDFASSSRQGRVPLPGTMTMRPLLLSVSQWPLSWARQGCRRWLSSDGYDV